MSNNARRYANASSSMRKSRKEKIPNRGEMVRRAHQRIIGAVRKRCNGFLVAHNNKDAIAQLKAIVRNTDGKLGKGKQVYGIIRDAFKQLCAARVFSRVSYGFKMNHHSLVHAA